MMDNVKVVKPQWEQAQEQVLLNLLWETCLGHPGNRRHGENVRHVNVDLGSYRFQQAYQNQNFWCSLQQDQSRKGGY